MRYFKVIVAVLALGLSGCFRSQEPLNPPQLVTARDTDMAIQLFMQANILLARYYGFEAIKYEELRDRSVRHGYSVIPFMPAISHRATPRIDQTTLKVTVRNESGEEFVGAAFRKWARDTYGADVHRKLLTNYVQTGWRAAQIVCRNYIIGLDEKNRYLEFLQKEFNIGAGLANAFLTLSHANVWAMSALNAIQVGGNLTIDEYQDFRFLAVDRHVALGLVEAAQNAYALDFIGKLNSKKLLLVPEVKATTDNFLPDFARFSDAVQVLNTIEYQCTRSGIRGLLNTAADPRKVEMIVNPRTNQLELE